jgi:hypothetical protein
VANSVGGFLPGDVMLKEQGKTPEEIATHPHPFYTPVATFGDRYMLEPVAYGLKFAGSFAGATLMDAGFASPLESSGVNATAYAARLADGRASVIVLNKDLEKDVTVALDFGTARRGQVRVEKLHAPAVDSREAHISAAELAGRMKDGAVTIEIPRASGVRVTVG